MIGMLATATTFGAAAFFVPNVQPMGLRAQQPRMDEAVEAAESDWKGAEGWSKQFAEPEPVFDVLAVKNVLPHRYPFLLVDKVIEFEPGKKAVGIKKVTANEEL